MSREAATVEPPGGRHRPSTRMDAVFLAGLVIVSSIPYIAGLGFASDDWAFLGVLSTAVDRSLGGLLEAQATNPNLAMRPLQSLYQAVLFRLFGMEPLGYHIVNLIMLVTVTILLWAVLRRLRMPRLVALAVPAVYGVAPNFSTVRFWFAAFGYLLTLALYLAALGAELRGASSGRAATAWRWKLLALVALGMAVLGYEVVLPFAVVNIVLAEVVARRVHRDGLRGLVGPVGRFLFHGTTVAVAAAAATYKATVAVGIGLSSSLFTHVLALAAGAVGANFGTYGVGLPHTVGWSVGRAGPLGVASAVVVGLAVFWYLGRASDAGSEDPRWPPRNWWLRLAAAGLAIFVLGYAVFLTTDRIGFSSTGIANRVAAAAALGWSSALVAVMGWAASGRPDSRRRSRFLRTGVALVCASCVLVIAGLGSFWARSWDAQRAIQADIHAALPELPSESTVLLHRVCPYVGPAVVFESSWDLEGALRVHYGDPTVRADVTANVIAVRPRGVVTRIYSLETFHPYGRRLFLYDRPTDTIHVVEDESSARRLFAEGDSVERCPLGEPGAGTVALPFDVAVGWFHLRLGR